MDVSAQEVNSLHNSSDVDSSRNAQHHTLGTRPTQAAVGNHGHADLTLGPAWVPYFPTLRSYGGDATIGNGVIDARYTAVGKSISIEVVILGGTTATWGTGGGGIAGLLPVPSRQSFTYMDFFAMQVNVGAGTSTVLVANAITTWHDLNDVGGAGRLGAFPVTVAYIVRATYEAL